MKSSTIAQTNNALGINAENKHQLQDGGLYDLGRVAAQPILTCIDIQKNEAVRKKDKKPWQKRTRIILCQGRMRHSRYRGDNEVIGAILKTLYEAYDKCIIQGKWMGKQTPKINYQPWKIVQRHAFHLQCTLCPL